ncbi:MAG: glucokinase [Actinomycetota bacterium]
MTDRSALRLGVDVGGTKCLAVAVDEAGNVVERRRVPTPNGAAALEEALVELVESFATPVDAWTSIGLGVPGLVSLEGVIVSSPNLPGIENFSVARRLGERFRRPIPVDNDANCAARAEWQVGAAQGARDALIITLGTGIGGGVVADGRLVRGAHGFAGEIGHVVVVAGGRNCACGRRGCWEQYASGTALRRLAREALDAGADWPQSNDEAVDVRQAAERGNEAALRVIDDFGNWVALGVATLAHVVDPEAVVIGGGVAHRADVVRDAVERHIADHLYASHVRPHPSIVLAHFGEDAGAIGAAFLEIDHVR